MTLRTEIALNQTRNSKNDCPRKEQVMSGEWDRIDPELRAIIEQHQQDMPVRISQIAKAVGVPVLAATLPAGISGEIRPAADGNHDLVIRVNRHDPETRQRFTVAHEVAHFLLHRDQIGNGIQDDVLYRSRLSDAREAEANRLAAIILMPRKLVKEVMQDARDLGVEDTVAYVAKRLKVSEAAARIRLGLG